MKLPPNYARQWVHGTNGRGNGHNAANGWLVRVGNKASFIPCRCAGRPGAIRERLEKVLGIVTKPKPTQEELIVARERMRAQNKRTFRNRLARGEDVTPPWAKPRTVRAVANEQRALEIAVKWQRLGEVRG